MTHSSILGLVSAHDFRQVRENLSSLQANELLQKQLEQEILSDIKEEQRLTKRRKMLSKLSFLHEDDGDVQNEGDLQFIVD